MLQEFGDSTRDLNVEPAWIQGLTGCNVVVAIVDDGERGCHFSSLPLMHVKVFP